MPVPDLLIPYKVLTSQAYYDGRAGRNYLPTSGPFSDWQRGSNESRGGGSGCLGWLIIIGLTLVLAIPAAISALISGLVLLILLKPFVTAADPSSKAFGTFYVTAFGATFSYLIIAVLLALFGEKLYGPELSWNDRFYVTTVLKYFFIFDYSEALRSHLLLKFHLPCIVVSGIVLFWMLSKSGIVKKIPGFLLSVLLAAFVILPVFMLLVYQTRKFFPGQFDFILRLF